MRGVLIVAICACMVVVGCMAQGPVVPPLTTSGTTLIGCLAGPDADDHYTLTSMQHRMGVDVVGGDELKSGAGAKVKLTGSWEALPGADATKGDAARRFRATAVGVLEDHCQAPSATTPVSKKKGQKK
jgi:hypothetical protein